MKKVIYALLYSGNICHSGTEEVATQSPKVAIQHPIIEKNNIKPKSSYMYIIIGLVCVFIAMILYFTLNNRKNEVKPNPVPIEPEKAIKRNQWRDKLLQKSKQENKMKEESRKLLLEWHKTNNIEEYRTDHDNEEINSNNLTELNSQVKEYEFSVLQYCYQNPNALPENCPLDLKQQGVNILILIEKQIRRLDLVYNTIPKEKQSIHNKYFRQRKSIINNKHIFNNEESVILWAYIFSPWISELEIRNCFA